MLNAAIGAEERHARIQLRASSRTRTMSRAQRTIRVSGIEHILILFCEEKSTLSS